MGSPAPQADAAPRKTRWLRWLALTLAALLLTAGCALLDEQQRRWIFQPGKETWGSGQAAAGMDDVWIDFDAAGATVHEKVRLHGLWLPQADAGAPLMLYLHGARWDLRSSAGRMRRMHELGFAVLGIDYRGFGLSTDALPSERSAQEDARAAWDWLAVRRPGARRFLYGHSLGSAIAVDLAAHVPAADVPAGLVLEGAFTSIPDLVAASKYGWLPLGPLITQRFDAAALIAQLKMPLLFVHGSDDHIIPAALGRALYDRAGEPKRFVLVEGASHHSAGALGFDDVRQAVNELFSIDPPKAPGPQARLP